MLSLFDDISSYVAPSVLKKEFPGGAQSAEADNLFFGPSVEVQGSSYPAHPGLFPLDQRDLPPFFFIGGRTPNNQSKTASPILARLLNAQDSSL